MRGRWLLICAQEFSVINKMLKNVKQSLTAAAQLESWRLLFTARLHRVYYFRQDDKLMNFPNYVEKITPLKIKTVTFHKKSF